MWRRTALVCILVLLVLAIPSQALAQSLLVSPGVLYAEDVPLGEKVFIYEIKVINKSDSSHFYFIYAKKPALVKEGYEEIPDPGWMKLEKSEIEVKAQSEGGIKVWVRVPNNEANASKSYEGWVAVGEKTGGIIAVEVAVRIFLSTLEYNASLPEEAAVEIPAEEIPPAEAAVEIPPVEIPPAEAAPVPSIKPINWTLIGGITSGVIVVALLVYFLVIRRRAA